MKVEMLQTTLHERDRYEEGEIRVVPDNLGEYFCANGWAKDTAGKVKTEKPGRNKVTLKPDDAAHGVTDMGV